MSIVSLWPWILTALDLGLASWVTVHAVMRKRDTRAAIAWTGLAWLAPFVGSFAYCVLGINRIERRATKLGLSEALQTRVGFSPSDQDLQEAASSVKAFPNLAGLAELGAALSGKALTPGNSVECLSDGDQTYPAMIEAIDGAKHSVGLLSYIFDSDRAGDAILEALLRARSRGVEVRVLVDHVGARYSNGSMVKRLKQAGIEAASFLPTRLFRLPVFANLRNHRKIMVVDGAVGFTGGTNIREAHWLALDPPKPTQCLHFRLQGPVVAHLQEVFVTDWAFTTGERLSGEAWFPEPERSGSVWARGITHGPDEDFETLAKVIFAGLAVARDRVRIVTPYFLPDQRLNEALAVAALRGVDVEIYVPSDNNMPIINWASAAQLGLIVQHGCRVFVTKPPFDHTKLMLVDTAWALIGSTNWDPRSLRLNFEFNVECYDSALASALHKIVDRKAEGAREITLEILKARRFSTRLRDGMARLLSPYL